MSRAASPFTGRRYGVARVTLSPLLPDENELVTPEITRLRR